MQVQNINERLTVWGSDLLHLEDHDTALELVWQPAKIPTTVRKDPVMQICGFGIMKVNGRQSLSSS